MDPLAWVVSKAIRGYKVVISPFLPPACRFHPTCSEYAVQALERFGIVKGSGLALRRILRCHPWNEGGFDPVPSRKDEGQNQ
ncbi:MAG: membrane protein insertion efficiency factor YidD [Acidobacteriota bacterium]|nr:MAG: membrane protein insertion efficiency factor YidD [Acidobacteriota bacterium]